MPGAGAAWSKARNNTSSTGAGTVISLIWSKVRRINCHAGVTGAVPGRHSVFGIIGLAFLSGREGNAVQPMGAKERQYLYFLFLYPEKYWKQLNYYYNANKVWIPEKNVEKLKTLESQKEARRRFLSRIK